MKTKFFLLAWLSTAMVMIVLNGLFHGVVAAGFFDVHNAPLGGAVLKMADFKPAPIVILEFILDFALLSILFRWRNEPIVPQDAYRIGGLFYGSTAATWNLANTASFVEWSMLVTFVDVAWHTVTGIFAGWMLARIFNLQFKTRPV